MNRFLGLLGLLLAFVCIGCDDLLDDLAALPPIFGGPPLPPLNPPPGPAPGGGPSCNGGPCPAPRQSVEGFGLAAVESVACQAAIDDAEELCQTAGCLLCAGRNPCDCSCSTDADTRLPQCVCSVIASLCAR